jgi:branched-chain amino acid transport system substrate-binding protein
MKKTMIFAVLMLAVVLMANGAVAQRTPVLKIGINAEITGDIPKVGESTKNAAQMYVEDVNKAGGIEVGGKKYKLELAVEDNEAKAESAAKAATKLITVDEVIALVGPQASKQAVPAGEIANNYKTPMISGWSTNPNTTLDRPFVFRACFLDDFQGPALAIFATEEYKFKKAAVLYDVASDYPKGLAEFFKKDWEAKHGPGSVVAYESFTTKDTDFSSQLTKIINSGADFIFTPQYYNEVPLIVQQAKQLGWKKPILGSDSWASDELVKLCGDDCLGSFFVSHYASAGATGATKEFIDRYQAKFGSIPDDVAALTWDAIGLIGNGIKNAGKITGDIKKDRESVRNAIAATKDFPGITGMISFPPGSGDPIKCANIVKINDKGEFEFYKLACP